MRLRLNRLICISIIFSLTSYAHCLKLQPFTVANQEAKARLPGFQPPPPPTGTRQLTAAEILVQGGTYTGKWPGKPERKGKVLRINVADGGSVLSRLFVVPLTVFVTARKRGASTTFFFWQLLLALWTLRGRCGMTLDKYTLPAHTRAKRGQMHIRMAITEIPSTVTEILDSIFDGCLCYSIGYLSLLASATLLMWSIRLANLWHFLPDKARWIEPAAVALPSLSGFLLAAVVQGAIDNKRTKHSRYDTEEMTHKDIV